MVTLRDEDYTALIQRAEKAEAQVAALASAARTLEEAAKVCDADADGTDGKSSDFRAGSVSGVRACAALIRALASNEKP